ncbi:hypothetical protein CBM2609_U20006 [Cupriavidus taiwanensis]|nr:hypothetical protein CBM2604_U20007 [Cupriavidus taiwanensis]SOZ34506.1 hypothetical protein CBM2609_U20006 [Cupriavidus taiwanensis]
MSIQADVFEERQRAQGHTRPADFTRRQSCEFVTARERKPLLPMRAVAAFTMLSALKHGVAAERTRFDQMRHNGTGAPR